MSLFIVLLFVLLTPGILLRLPAKGSKLTVALVHGIVFALVFHFFHKVVGQMTPPPIYEGLTDREKFQKEQANIRKADAKTNTILAAQGTTLFASRQGRKSSPPS